MLAQALRASASVPGVGADLCSGDPSDACCLHAPRRGRAPTYHVAFHDTSFSSEDERVRRYPVSAPAPSRPVSFMAPASATTTLDDGDLCLAGFPADAVPREPTSASTVSDADIDARLDWCAVADGGRLPCHWLAPSSSCVPRRSSDGPSRSACATAFARFSADSRSSSRPSWPSCASRSGAPCCSIGRASSRRRQHPLQQHLALGTEAAHGRRVAPRRADLLSGLGAVTVDDEICTLQ